MKKLFSIVLAVVMVLSIASSALAFTWDASSSPINKTLDERYTLEVVKYTKQTGGIASYSYIANPSATAVNGADVYFAIKLTVKDADKKDDADAVQLAAELTYNIESTAAITNVAGAAPLKGSIKLEGIEKGTYYLDLNNAAAKLSKASDFAINNVNGPIYEAKCLDTDAVKVSAKIESKRNLTAGFTWEGYTVAYKAETTATPGQISFAKGGNTTTFTLDAATAKVSKTETTSTSGNAYEAALLAKLGISAEALDKGSVYMTASNLRTAFGWNYKAEQAITWKANSTPIILDPTVGIPKTGDNASVIGFAMIMVAVVAAAVAVKKVNA